MESTKVSSALVKVIRFLTGAENEDSQVLYCQNGVTVNLGT